MSVSQKRVLVTVTGRDAPGITSALTKVVAENRGRLLDIEQVVVHGHLILGLLLDVDPAPAGGDTILKDLLFAANELGMELRFTPLSAQTAPSGDARSRFALTAVSDEITSEGLHLISQVLAEKGANIESIRQLSQDRLASVELMLSLVAGQTPRELREELMTRTESLGIDLALQPETLLNRSKRLIVMDMDSTLIKIEVIDELAGLAGVKEQVVQITKRAMAGELDYTQSLKERVALLKGLEMAKVERLVTELPLTEGAESLIVVLKKLGLRTGVISGGFSVAADSLKSRLGLDYAYSNRLEVVDGKLTGHALEPIVSPQRKADLLETIAQGEGIDLEQTIAVGDGANDLGMLERAGLGIAFHAKTKLKAAADTAVSAGGLDRILFLLGLTSRDVRHLLSRA